MKCQSWFRSGLLVLTALPLIAGVGFTGEAWGQSCLALAGRSDLGYVNKAALRDVVVRGQYAFGADAYGLAVWNISDPSHPFHVTEWDAPEAAQGVALGPNGLVLVADGSSGLFILDLSDPVHPHELGKVVTGGNAKGVAVAGMVAYVVDGDDGLQVVDVSDPAHAHITGSMDTNGDASGVAVSGTVAYVADGDDGLQLVDVSDPANPHLTGGVDTDGDAHGVAVSGTVAYVADGDDGLQVVDVSDPAHPHITGGVDAAGYAVGVTISGLTAYVSGGPSGLHIVDVSDPAQPKLISTLGTNWHTWAVAMSGTIAYVADWEHGLQVIDVSDPTNPHIIASMDTTGYVNGLAISGTTAYVADGGAGLQVVDISDPTNPQVIGRVDTHGYAGSIAISGTTAYVADGDDGLQAVDISDPNHPRLLGSVDTPGWANDVVVAGTKAYVADGPSGFQAVDISDPTNLEIIGSVDTPGYAESLVLSGTTAYVADFRDGLQVVDVSDPTSPHIIGSVGMNGYADAVAISGTTAYLTDGEYGLQAVDISDPTNPQVTGSVDTRGYAGSIAISGTTAYVANGGGGLQLVDISDPAHPQLTASININGYVDAVAVSGTTVLVGNGFAFEVVTTECRAPEAGFTWDTLDLHVAFRDKSLYGPTAWSWDFGDGSISTARSPVHTYDSPGTYTVHLTVSNDEGSDTVSHDVFVGYHAEIGHPGSNIYVIPGSGHTPGVNGVRWVSDMVLWNGGPEDAHANVFFLKSGQDNSGVTGTSVTVRAGTSLQLRDVVWSMFGQNQASGAILVGSDQPLIVTSRTYNNASSGTYGQFIAGIPIGEAIGAGQKVRLIQLTRTGNYRTNIGFTNVTNKALSIQVAMYRSDGSMIATRSYTVQPYGFYQKTDIIGTDVPDAYAVMSSSTPGAKFFTYASVVDRRTGDPVFITPESGTATAGQSLYIPAAAHTVGVSGTAWRTDLEIHNPGSITASYKIELLKLGHNNSSPESRTYQLAGNHSVRYTDALQSLFEDSGSGALRITSLSGTITVTSRTYNQTSKGTYGQFIASVPASSTILPGKSIPVIELSQSSSDTSGYRTNIGFVNTSGKTMTVDVDLFNEAGTELGTKPVTLKPYEFTQVGKIFRPFTSETLANCYAVLHTPTSGGSFLGYASVVDNRSGDPVYVPAFDAAAP